jgi:hypothetical protein
MNCFAGAARIKAINWNACEKFHKLGMADAFIFSVPRLTTRR